MIKRFKNLKKWKNEFYEQPLVSSHKYLFYWKISGNIKVNIVVRAHAQWCQARQADRERGAWQWSGHSRSGQCMQHTVHWAGTGTPHTSTSVTPISWIHSSGVLINWIIHLHHICCGCDHPDRSRQIRCVVSRLALSSGECRCCGFVGPLISRSFSDIREWDKDMKHVTKQTLDTVI